jgi:hypothetical protein
MRKREREKVVGWKELKKETGWTEKDEKTTHGGNKERRRVRKES